MTELADLISWLKSLRIGELCDWLEGRHPEHGSTLAEVEAWMSQVAASARILSGTPASPPSQLVLPLPASPSPAAVSIAPYQPKAPGPDAPLPTPPSFAVTAVASLIVSKEGKYASVSGDHGGATQYGITQAVALRHGIADVRSITPQIAIAIMVSEFYLAPRLDKLPQPIQPQMFDMSVNSGPAQAIKILQHALGLAVDGLLGPATISGTEAAVQAHGWKAVNNAVVAARVAFMQALVVHDPSQAKFEAGWLNRARSFQIP